MTVSRNDEVYQQCKRFLNGGMPYWEFTIWGLRLAVERGQYVIVDPTYWIVLAACLKDAVPEEGMLLICELVVREVERIDPPGENPGEG